MTHRGRWVITGLALTAMITAVGTVVHPRQSQWFALVDRSGQVERLGEAPRWVFAPRVSPDGTRLVYDRSDGTLWIAPLSDVSRAHRLAAMPEAQFPLWRGDGANIFYIAALDSAQALFVMRADGSRGPRTPLRQPARAPESWSIANEGLTFITLIDDYDVWFHSMAQSSSIPVAVRAGSASTGVSSPPMDAGSPTSPTRQGNLRST
jgi:hypothetical protein